MQAATRTCGCASVVVALLCGGCADNPWMIRQRSCRENAAITICDQQVCQHSHFIRPFHTGLHSNEYYSALSYALQIPANDMLFFFPLLCGAPSPNARRSHELCQLQMRLAVISRPKKFGTQYCEECREHVMNQIKQNLLVFFWPAGVTAHGLSIFCPQP